MGRIATAGSVLLGLSLAVACSPQGENEDMLEVVGNDSQEVLGGTAAAAGQFPAVVAVRVQGGGLCTGTLVAPDLVLTAAHCVSPRISGLPSQEAVTSATNVIFDTSSVFQPSPGAFGVSASWTAISTFSRPGDPDIGLIRLSQPVTDRKPIAINYDPALAATGTMVDFVGYGISDSGNSGTAFFLKGKQAITCGNFGISDLNFMCFDQRSGSGICSGDSGGSAISDIGGVPTVVGINSFVSGGQGQQCTGLGATYRTDVARAWIKQNAPDLLCISDEVCDPACGAGGEPVDPDCQPACVSDSDCDSDSVCSASACIPAPLSPGGLGSSCASGEDCFSGDCAGAADDQRCVSSCFEDSECPSGFTCREASNGGGVCWESGGGGGCSAGGAQNGLWMVLLAGLGLIVVRRRRS